MGVHVRCPVSPHGTLFGSLCEGGRPTGPRPEVHYSRSIFRQRIMKKICKNSKRMYASRESATQATMAAAQEIKRHDNGVDPLLPYEISALRGFSRRRIRFRRISTKEPGTRYSEIAKTEILSIDHVSALFGFEPCKMG